MTSTNSNLLMLGLRGSGKTTYLAALWHFLESGELSSRLVTPELQPDREYLNRIRNSWLSFNEVGRTPLRGNQTVSLSVRDTSSEENIDLTIPDMSGETFRLQWVTRKAPASYEHFTKTCSGALLFIHPSELKKTSLIVPQELFAKPNDRDIAESSDGHGDNWSPEHTSSQVQFVDLLQLLWHMRDSEKALRLAVVVSAWDTIHDDISPVAWLERRLPLLSQFLLGNSERIPSQVFGISAQGGDLVRDRETLLAQSTPSMRPRVIGGETIDELDLTAPLQFLLNLGPAQKLLSAR